MADSIRSCAQQLTEAIERLEGKTFDSWARFGIDDPSPLEPEWWADRVKPLLANQDRFEAALERISELKPAMANTCPIYRRTYDGTGEPHEFDCPVGISRTALKGKRTS